MKNYSTPETQVLQVKATTFLCGSETPEPQKSATSTLGGMSVKLSEGWTKF